MFISDVLQYYTDMRDSIVNTESRLNITRGAIAVIGVGALLLTLIR
jgi:hypothetical protein